MDYFSTGSRDCHPVPNQETQNGREWVRSCFSGSTAIMLNYTTNPPTRTHETLLVTPESAFQPLFFAKPKASVGGGR